MTYEMIESVVSTYQGNREALARYLSSLGCGRVEFCRGLIIRMLSKKR